MGPTRRRRKAVDEVLARIAANYVEDMMRWKHHEDYAWGIVFGAYSALTRIASDRDKVRLDEVYERWEGFRKAFNESTSHESRRY